MAYILVRTSCFYNLQVSHTEWPTLEAAQKCMKNDYEKTMRILDGTFEEKRNESVQDETAQRWANLSELGAHIQTGADFTDWRIIEVSQHPVQERPAKKVRYELITAIEEELDAVGIYESLEQAQSTMRELFADEVGKPLERLDDWLENTDEAGICEMCARALESVTEDGMNHDWKIIPILCEGACEIQNTDI